MSETEFITEEDRRLLGQLARHERDPREWDAPASTSTHLVDNSGLERKGTPTHVIALIEELDERGCPHVRIAEELGVSRATVQRYAPSAEYRDGPKNDRALVDQRRCNTIRANVADGVTQAVLADFLDCDPSTVHYHARGHCDCPAELPPVELEESP